MIKKLGLFIPSFIAILGVGVSFANPIAPTNLPDICYKIKNVEINNYRVVLEHGKKYNNSDLYTFGLDNREWKVYEPKSGKCTECSHSHMNNISKVYLLDKSIDIKDITQENIYDKAIFIGTIGDSTCSSYHNKINTYKIINEGGTYKLKADKIIEMKKINEFPFFLLGAIIIETLLLFYIAKLFRKENQISNKKLFLFGIIPTTITLPLLWFVLPLILGNGIGYTIIGELLVTTIEAIIIKYGLRISRMNAIICSVICNFFSFFILSYKEIFNIKHDTFNKNFLTSTRIMVFLLYIFIREVTLPFIVKVLQKNDEISNKRLILIGVLAPIISIIITILLTKIMAQIFPGEIWPLFVAIGIYLVSELLIIEYGLKISWKKSIMALIFPILCLMFLSICLSVIY